MNELNNAFFKSHPARNRINPQPGQPSSPSDRPRSLRAKPFDDPHLDTKRRLTPAAVLRAKLCLAAVMGLPLLACSLPAAPADVAFRLAAPTVDVYDFAEVALHVAQPDAANPFTDVTIEGEFRRAGSPPLKVDGFCDAAHGSVFRIRFMPTQPGEHH